MVGNLKKDLTKLVPEIDKKETETQAMVVNLEEQTAIAAEEEKKTAVDEEKAKIIQNEVMSIKRGCE